MKSGLEGRNNFGRQYFYNIPRYVSMKSGLEGRNNRPSRRPSTRGSHPVSMKSGLEGRNNTIENDNFVERLLVSMKSGLEGRNNPWRITITRLQPSVSMKSGLEGRNNILLSKLIFSLKNLSQ